MTELFNFDMTEATEERAGIMADSGIHDEALAVTYAEKNQAECEARFCLNKLTLEARREYLVLITKHRGEAGRKSLEAAIMTEWNSRKAAHQAKKEAA